MTITSPAGGMPWRYLLLVAVLYYGCARLGMVTAVPEGMAVLWLPNSVVLASLIRFGGSRIAALAAVVVATEVVADVPTFTPTEAVLFGLINFSESALAYTLLRRWRFDPEFSALADLWKFVLAGPLIAAFCAALLGGLVYTVFRGGETGYLEFTRIWWFGDGLGLLILTPLFLHFGPFRSAPLAPSPRLETRDAVFLAAAAAAVVLLWTSSEGKLFGMHFGPVILLPFALYAATRYPERWVSAIVVLFATVVVLSVTGGRMPFGPLPARDAVVLAQEFIFTMSITAVGFASLLAQVRRRQEELEARVAERTGQLRGANERLATLAYSDPLTGVFNRRHFDDTLATETARARRQGSALALVMVDLDHFKSVNDRYGHGVGDAVLVAAAAALKARSRPYDVVARYGGEEFVLLLPEMALEPGVEYAERLRMAIAAMTVEGFPGRVTASFGVVTLSGDEDVRTFLARADAALYRAKQDGRDRVVRG